VNERLLQALAIIRAIEEHSLRMREALAASDLAAASAALVERQRLVSSLVNIDARALRTAPDPKRGPECEISIKIKDLIASSEALISSFLNARDDIGNKRRQNAVAREALRSYLCQDDSSINTRVVDG
jgi:hypothetical protein